MLNQLLAERKLPDIWPDRSVPWEQRRAEIIKTALSEEYGDIVNYPKKQEFTVLKDMGALGGSAIYREVMLKFDFETGHFEFPAYVLIPKREGKVPFFVNISFMFNLRGWPPVEEIIERGFGLILFNYQAVTVDDCHIGQDLEVFDDGIYPLISQGTDPGTKPGKIRVWAWAASRVLDMAATMPELDMERAAVTGHSRLGKTTMLAGLLDERFKYVCPNASGAGGLPVFRGNTGESFEQVYERFPYWFCPNYAKYLGHLEDFPFDQHALVAACAPRYVCAGAADDDNWCGDVPSVYLSCVAAGEIYKALGHTGFVCPDRLPVTDDVLLDGDIGFHLRKGTHAHTRLDWLRYMDFIEKHS